MTRVAPLPSAIAARMSVASRLIVCLNVEAMAYGSCSEARTDVAAQLRAECAPSRIARSAVRAYQLQPRVRLLRTGRRPCPLSAKPPLGEPGLRTRFQKREDLGCGDVGWHEHAASSEVPKQLYRRKGLRGLRARQALHGGVDHAGFVAQDGHIARCAQVPVR